MSLTEFPQTHFNLTRRNGSHTGTAVKSCIVNISAFFGPRATLIVVLPLEYPIPAPDTSRAVWFATRVWKIDGKPSFPGNGFSNWSLGATGAVVGGRNKLEFGNPAELQLSNEGYYLILASCVNTFFYL